jgi:hypothetical protein
MKIILAGAITVKNWSKDPLLTLNGTQQAKLAASVRTAREMAAGSLSKLREYRQKRVVKSVDAQMAKDLFPSGAVVKDALERYFGITTASPGFDTDLGTIITKLAATETGLKGQLELVVGNIHDADDIREGISDAFDSLKQGKFKAAIDDLKFIRTGTRGWVSSNALQRIHLNIDIINSDPEDRIARTIVHEATHKFAGTDDIAYKADNLKHNAGGHANLTNNADSYAWCCRRIWKKT